MHYKRKAFIKLAMGSACALVIAGYPAFAIAEDSTPPAIATAQGVESQQVPPLHKPTVIETQPVALVNVANVEVKGNKVVLTQDILKVTDIKPGDQVDPDKLQERLQGNLNLIIGLGTFADAKANVVQFRNGLVITYTVQENPTVSAIAINGNKLMDAAAIQAVLASKPGSLADRNLIQKDMEAISKLYQDKGYAVADVNVELSPDQTLSFKVLETMIGTIKVSGNDKTKERVIKRELLSKEGEPFDRNKIQTELRRVLNLGFFEEVTPKFEPGDKPEIMDYTVDVKEQRTGKFNGGVTYSPTDGIVGNITVEEPNIFGNAQGIRLNYEAGFKGSKTLEASFFEPRLRDTRTNMTLHVFNKDTRQTDFDTIGTDGKHPQYTEHRVGGDAQFGLALAENDRLNVGLGSEYTENHNVDKDGNKTPYTFEGIDQDGRTNFVDIGYSRDTRDNFLDPKKGYRASVSSRLAGGWLLRGDNSFTKYTGTYSTYAKIFGQSVAAFRISGGQALHPQGSYLPAQEKFRLGGPDNLRGYDYGAIAGDSMFYSNAEFRYPVQNKGYLVAFTDVGNAWNVGQSADKPKVSAGLGVRVNTPIGPLRLDYGWRKADESGQGLVGKFHFSFGQTF